jgi:bifunctional non-homologous end joining protein LigD
MLAPLVKEPFDRPGWIYEEKYDGVRILAYKEGARVALMSRNAIDRTERYATIAEAVERLKPVTLLLDGEVVVFDKRNVSRFQLLQQGHAAVKYAVFDCLYFDGQDMRDQPLSQRREALEKLFRRPHLGSLLLSEELASDGLKAFAIAKKRKLEGLVAKNMRSKYVQGRSHEWLKVKVNHENEFVIGGYTPPGDSRKYLGALLVGTYDGQKLRYAGKVGTGFDTEMLRQLSSRLKKLAQAKSPFSNEVRERKVTFVRPKLVAQIAFTEWTSGGRLRHPAFIGLRDDKAPQEVHREEA